MPTPEPATAQAVPQIGPVYRHKKNPLLAHQVEAFTATVVTIRWCDTHMADGLDRGWWECMFTLAQPPASAGPRECSLVANADLDKLLELSDALGALVHSLRGEQAQQRRGKLAARAAGMPVEVEP